VTTRIVVVVAGDEAAGHALARALEGLGYAVAGIAGSDAAAIAVERLRPDVAVVDGDAAAAEVAAVLQGRLEIPLVALVPAAPLPHRAPGAPAAARGGIVELRRSAEPEALRMAVELALHRDRADRELRLRERLFVTTLRAIGDGVIATDPEGRITFVNPVAELLTGVPLAEARGQPYEQVLRLQHAEDATALEGPVRRALDERRRVGLPAAVVLEGRARQILVEHSAAPVLDDQERLLGAVVVFRDVTARKELEQRLSASDRLVSLGTMTAGLAHEINNPLAFVSTNVDYARRSIEECARCLGALEADAPGTIAANAPGAVGQAQQLLTDALAACRDAQEGGERLRELTRDLTVFSRSGESRAARVDLRGLLEGACKLATNQIRHRARLHVSHGPTPGVRAPEAQLGQVFLNLLVNAAQAIPEGHVEENAITVRTGTDEGGHALVEISDTGCGMPPDVLRRIFDPFFTTKPVGIGTGLGLFIAYQTITGMGGEISVKSEEGRGSTFSIRLPAAPGEAPAQPAAAVTTTPPAERRRARILVIDDEPLVGRIFQRALRGHDVTVATNGRQGLELLLAGAFDVIFCDVMMADLAGTEVYLAAAERAPDEARKFVFVTGGACTPETQAVIARVDVPRLRKPFSMDELHDLLLSKLEDERAP
jgi:PAS domain S-box-containing protein